MRDEEHIELEQRMHPYSKTKQVYKLRGEDFIPIFGLYNHQKRCLDKSSPLKLTSNRDLSQFFARELGLGFYNFTIIGGAIMGLVELLSK
jgi:hypothetical protein